MPRRDDDRSIPAEAAERADQPGSNPTTGVHLLTEIIRIR